MRLSVLFAMLFLIPPARAADPPVVTQADLIKALVQSLDDPDGEVRQNIAIALANLGDTVVPALLTALEDPSVERRSGAAMALGQIRPAATTAIPSLIRAMKDKDEMVRRQASYSLSRMVQKGGIIVLAVPPAPPPDPFPASGEKP